MHDLSLTRQPAVGSADCARLAERRSPIRPHCRTDAGCWTLVVGRWTLDLGPWTLDLGRWTLDVGPWMFCRRVGDRHSGRIAPITCRGISPSPLGKSSTGGRFF